MDGLSPAFGRTEAGVQRAGSHPRCFWGAGRPHWSLKSVLRPNSPCSPNAVEEAQKAEDHT